MSEKVAKLDLKRDHNYLYFVDKDGDVSRTLRSLPTSGTIAPETVNPPAPTTSADSRPAEEKICEKYCSDCEGYHVGKVNPSFVRPPAVIVSQGGVSTSSGEIWAQQGTQTMCTADIGKMPTINIPATPSQPDAGTLDDAIKNDIHELAEAIDRFYRDSGTLVFGQRMVVIRQMLRNFAASSHSGAEKDGKA